ncbi:hypothetical protein KP509_37G028200 [Ceratopteris richardii]|nr:hypothetical protein KP509_37G028200 [Ceratopteris richardii]
MSDPSLVKEMTQELRLKHLISDNGNELRRYHGTTTKCQLGRPALGNNAEATPTRSLCKEDECSLCRIIQNGFMTKKCRTERYQRYGKGIYTSQCSSKASGYVRCSAPSFSSDGNNNLKVMMICKVLAGRPFATPGKYKDLQKPPPGFHSVQGIRGLDLNYDELVVYTDDAILPNYIIFYTSSD